MCFSSPKIKKNCFLCRMFTFLSSHKKQLHGVSSVVFWRYYWTYSHLPMKHFLVLRFSLKRSVNQTWKPQLPLFDWYFSFFYTVKMLHWRQWGLILARGWLEFVWLSKLQSSHFGEKFHRYKTMSSKLSHCHYSGAANIHRHTDTQKDRHMHARIYTYKHIYIHTYFLHISM